jgi:hypothetical protein
MSHNTDFKVPLLPIEKETDTARTDATFQNTMYTRGSRQMGMWPVRALQMLVLLGLVYLSWPQYSLPGKCADPTGFGSGSTHVHHDQILNYTKRELVHFDIDELAYAPVSAAASITESLSICQYSYAWNATGRVRFAAGDPQQPYNFMVGVDLAGSSQQAIDSVVWPIHSKFNSMYIRCVEFRPEDEAITDWDATIHVDVTVFVKPHTLQFGEFKVTTGVLDIEIDKGLTYETYHMHLYSREGDIYGKEIQDFTAHDISAVAQSGSITGNWSLPGKIVLQTGGRNPRDKGIDIDLAPKMWSSGPSTQGIISATTQGGDIDIRMPLNDNLSLRNMSINVQSQVGSISGTFVTGYHTSLSTLSGSIDATLLPYFGLQDTCTYTTSTAAGSTTIRVLPPIIDDYYRINPLKNTKSDHTVRSGSLNLSYPPQWVGAALGLSETGYVYAEGDRFRTIVQEDHLVVARTDDEIASRLDFSTTTGTGMLVIE